MIAIFVKRHGLGGTSLDLSRPALDLFVPGSRRVCIALVVQRRPNRDGRRHASGGRNPLQAIVPPMVATRRNGRSTARMHGCRTTGLSAGGETHRGHVRETNQDIIVVEPRLGLYAVLDGMGGHRAGGVAARMAGTAMVDILRTAPPSWWQQPRALLRGILSEAAVTVHAAAQQRRAYEGMGTTVVACLIVEPRRVVICHAGDSRAYLLRDRELVALTRDHTVAQQLMDSGARRIPKAARHTLTRNLGAYPGVAATGHEQELQPGDRLLLCSDGLYRGASINAIRRVLGADEAPDRIAKQLVELVLRGKAYDNVSAVVITVERSPARAASSRPSARARARTSQASGARRARR
jgi:protein phosphatase